MSVWGRRSVEALGAVVPIAIAMALLVACGKGVDARSSAPSHVAARSAGDEPVREATLIRPPIDVPEDLGVLVRRVDPGRYATLTEYHQATAARGRWADWASVSSVALELDPSGRARACRGQRAAHLSPGEHLRGEAQRGLSGRWRRDGSWVDVRLRSDDAVCSSHSVGLSDDDREWHLRCLAVESDERAAPFAGRALACRVTAGEWIGYAIPGALPEGEWMLLATGRGLHVRADDDQTRLAGVTPGGERSAVDVAGLALDVGPARHRVDGESWREP